MASTQEIHHSPVDGEEFHIQDGSFWVGPEGKPPVCKNKPHKKYHKCPKKPKCEHEKKWFNHEESDHCTLDSDSCLDFGHENSSCCKVPKPHKPVCDHSFKKCFEFDECFDCKDQHKEFLICTNEFHDCEFPHKECFHCEGNGHTSFECEERFKKGLACSHRLGHTTFQCIGHSRLCLFELIRRCSFFFCHRPEPWKKAHKKHI